MIGLIVDPLVLCFLVWIVARESADVNFAVMFFICLGVALAGFAMGIFIGPWAMIPTTLLMGYLLMKHFYLTLNQAITVLVLFDLIHLGVWYLTST